MLFKSSFAVLLLSAIANGAAVVPKSALDVFVPKIFTPTAETVWTVGQNETVTWDNSNPPEHISNLAGVYLRGVGFLLQGFDLRAGSVQVTVPAVTPGQYQIILFGDSGNTSPFFAIRA